LRREPKAEELLTSLTDVGLVLRSDQGVVTWAARESQTVIDLVFVNAAAHNLVERYITSRAPELNHGSDHFPILTTFNLEKTDPPDLERFNLAKVDWEKMREDVEAPLEVSTKKVKNSKFPKRWWDEDLTELCAKASKQRNR
ncbi:hypothetical protein BT69DRAFT_1181917, partial [Atractiella rhizophila]